MSIKVPPVKVKAPEPVIPVPAPLSAFIPTLVTVPSVGDVYKNPFALEFTVRTCPAVPIFKADNVSVADANKISPIA